MSYFDDYDRRERRYGRGGFTTFLLFLLAAILGAVITLAAAHSLGYLNSAGENNQALIGGNSENGEDSLAQLDLLSVDDEVSVVSVVAAKVRPAVVGVTAYTSSNNFWMGMQEVATSTGSGVIIDEEGYIVTNNHVIADASRLEVTLHDGTSCEATLVGTDIRTDLAVLKIETDQELTVATFGDSDELMVGEIAIAIGNPGGNDFAGSTTVGFVSGLNRLIVNSDGVRLKVVQTDAAINPGNSGGALVNRNGEIIGINSNKLADSNYEGMGFAIPSNTVKEVVEQLIQYQKVIRPALNVTFYYNVTPTFAELNNLSVDYGVVVEVAAGGVSAAAGMQTYDIILAINGEKIEDWYDLQDNIFSREVGETVTVTIYRPAEDTTMDLEVTLSQLE